MTPAKVLLVAEGKTLNVAALATVASVMQMQDASHRVHRKFILVFIIAEK